MARDRAKFDEVMLAIVARLIDQVDGARAENCYLSLNPEDTPSPNPGTFVFVVSPPMAGNFDEGMIDGGGAQQATNLGDLRIGIHSPVQLDETNRDTQFLTNSTLGILETWRQVVKALTPWSPGDAESDPMTRDPLIPSGFVIRRKNRSIGMVVQNFRLTFDLDLT